MRNLISDHARHRWETVMMVVVVLLVAWGGGWLRLAGACTGLMVPLPLLAAHRHVPTCREAVPSATQILGTLGGLAAAGLILRWMDRDLRR